MFLISGKSKLREQGKRWKQWRGLKWEWNGQEGRKGQDPVKVGEWERIRRSEEEKWGEKRERLKSGQGIFNVIIIIFKLKTSTLSSYS